MTEDTDQETFTLNDAQGLNGLLFSETDKSSPEIQELGKLGSDWDLMEKMTSRLIILEERNRLMTELLGGVCRELSTSLTGIKGLSGSLVQQDIKWEYDVQQDFLRTIEKQADKLSCVVDDLWQAWRLETGLMELERTLTTFSVVMGQIIDHLKILTAVHQFETNIASSTQPLYIDAIRIEEVITGLVERAVLSSNEGTRIVLEAEQVDEEMVISVSDWSRGVPPKTIERFFDSFYHMKGGISNGNTGLRLLICKRIVEAHNGRIWVESKPGRGCKFSFCLPIMTGKANEG